MGKKKRPVVKGAQLASRVLMGKAKGAEPQRTMRMRFVEPPAKRKGNPFVAVRVPVAMLEAFERICKKAKTTPSARIRKYIAKATGIAEGASDGE